MRLTRERLLLLALLAALVAVWWGVWREVSRATTITFLDVGQGDSILVQAASGKTMLVDGGGWQGQEASGYNIGREVVLPALLARGVRRIDALVVTHPHDDHVGGLAAVADQVTVGMVLDPELESTSETYARFREEVEKRKIRAYRATEGQRLNLGDGVYVEMLNPPDPRLAGTRSETNDNSVVMRLVEGRVSVLLAGDIDRAGAERMARLGEALHSTVLKVPHHGSAQAAVPGFVEAVRPELAVISVGARNQFGHPSDEMLGELERVGAKVMRTDRDGAVTLRLRPPRWWAWGYGGKRRFEGSVEPVSARQRR